MQCSQICVLNGATTWGVNEQRLLLTEKHLTKWEFASIIPNHRKANTYHTADRSKHRLSCEEQSPPFKKEIRLGDVAGANCQCKVKRFPIQLANWTNTFVCEFTVCCTVNSLCKQMEIIRTNYFTWQTIKRLGGCRKSRGLTNYGKHGYLKEYFGRVF